MTRAAALPLLFGLALAGCGLEPVYSGGSHGAVATALAGIEVAPIRDRAGFLIAQGLKEQLGTPTAAPRYRLEVELDDKITSFGIRGDNSSARERRTLRARYRLVALNTDGGSGEVVLDATAAADSGIDRVSSDYAVVAAETTALDRLSESLTRQIVAKVALYVRAQAAR